MLLPFRDWGQSATLKQLNYQYSRGAAEGAEVLVDGRNP